MDIRSDERCFVCGSDNPDGLQVRFTLERERGRASCTVRLAERFQGWEGIAHGGILSTLLDEAAIYACRCEGEQFVTAGLAVRFRKPVPVGEVLEVSAEIRERRRRLYKVRSEVRVAGELHAEAEVEVVAVGTTAAAGKENR